MYRTNIVYSRFIRYTLRRNELGVLYRTQTRHSYTHLQFIQTLKCCRGTREWEQTEMYTEIPHVWNAVDLLGGTSRALFYM